MKTGRRSFLESVALAAGSTSPDSLASAELHYPRIFTGRQLSMIAFPLGGVATGTISLGGRGQLRDWEIFNRPDKGKSPEYAFASIWARQGDAKPVARVLEARLMPPYEGATGLGSKNAPGLRRMDGATFTGEYPIARIDFHDTGLPVLVMLEAFSPFIPLDAEDSGLPVAILRYRVRNRGRQKATVSIAFSVENPVGTAQLKSKGVNEYRAAAGLHGLYMTNPAVPGADPLNGSFALCLLRTGQGKLTHVTRWPNARWWASPMLFWDDYTLDGELGTSGTGRPVGSLCLKQEVDAGAEASYTFLLSWHFPNRTPEWCGWRAPKGEEWATIGNYYCTRFGDAWHSAEYTARKLKELEARTRAFVATVRQSTLPAAVKDAAMSNLSTLATQTCFRTAEGEFRGFEGCDDQAGCCFGNCVHVWNYEAATAHLLPDLSRSMRKTAFFASSDQEGRMDFRQLLPEGKERFGVAAADGQMGQVMKAYLDWRLSGDMDWLRKMWPALKRGLEFAWIAGGWDSDRDGVMEGVQHNTYDVEFFGPNPQCGTWYLGALRAGEEMARAVGDESAAHEYRRLFERGSRWIDENLFNGEYYVQKIRGTPGDQIAKGLMSARGADDPEHPEDYQVGDGCLVDQLVGQYFAEVAGLGSLLDRGKVRKALESICRYNYKRGLAEHEAVQRVFALNDERALVICDYASGQRPLTPFPYFAEVMTGFEYSAAILMLYSGMVAEGLECIENIRRRYDGERRNPWDEAECGHHYARAMAAWSAILALSGFRYHGVEKSLAVEPRLNVTTFASFWSTATGWGKFTHLTEGGQTRFRLGLAEGTLPVRTVTLGRAGRGATSAQLGGRVVPCVLRRTRGRISFAFREEITLYRSQELVLAIEAGSESRP